MKVAQFFNYMNLDSTAVVYGINVNEKGNKTRIFYADIRVIPEWMKKAKLNSFTLKNNEIRIFYEL